VCGIPPLLLLSLVALIASPLHTVDCLIVIISLLLLFFFYLPYVPISKHVQLLGSLM